MGVMRLTIVIVAALLAWLWVTRSTIHPSLIMSWEMYQRAKAASERPSFCAYPAPKCRVG